MRRLYIFLFLLLTLSGCQNGKNFEQSLNETFEQTYNKIAAAIEDIETPNNNEPAQNKIVPDRTKIAVLVPLSGAASASGKAIADAAKLAVSETDFKGLDLVIYDSSNTPEGAEKAAEKAVKENAKIILGPVFSAQAKAVAKVAAKENIKIFSFSNNKEISNKNVFVLGLIPEQQILQQLEFAFNKGRVGISAILPKNPLGEEIRRTLNNFARENPVKIRAVAYYAGSEKEFSKQASIISEVYKNEQIDIEAAQTELIVVPEGEEKLERIINALRKEKITTKNVLLIGTNMWNHKNAELVAAEGAWFASVPHEKFASFAARFKKAYGYEPEQIAALGYDAVSLAANLKAENFKEKAIFSESGFNGISGLFRLKKNGANERVFEIMQVGKDGEKTIVKPAPAGF